MSIFLKPLVVFTLLITTISCQLKKSIDKPSNIVFIFADDLGYGDLACFGATDIKTPHIDRLAKEGIKFTNLYSASSVCSPSRAGLLTGRYPQRWGLHGVYFPNSFSGMPNSEITIAEVLKKQGYATGIVGKWHLGHLHDHAPLQQGFDSYFGIPYSNDMENAIYMRDNSVEAYNIDQSQMVKRYTDESLKFINNHKDEPFFLYLAHNMPHVPLYASEDFVGTSERGLYGDVIQEIDWGVGEIIHQLEKLSLLENTIIVFSSDNGPWLVMEDHGGSSGQLREGKQFTFDGGMKVPTVAMWKGKISGGSTYDKVISQMDWFPTFSNLTGAIIPDSIPIDGYDITSVLLNTGDRAADEVLLFGIEGEIRSYRKGDYKLKLPYEGYEGSRWRQAVAAHDTMLINISKDPGEHQNIMDDRKKVVALYQDMNKALDHLGALPSFQVHRTPQDNSHFSHLTKKHGEGVQYWKKNNNE